MNEKNSSWRFAGFVDLFKKINNVGWYVALDYFFDFPLYYFMVRRFGLVWGGGSTVLLGLIIDLAMFKWYSDKGQDIFGLERIKEYRDYAGDSKRRLWISKCMKKSDFFAMCVIAFFSNPCLTLIYVRRRHEADRKKMNLKDYLVFCFSMFIEAVWAGVIYGAVLIERFALHPMIDYVFK